MIKITEWCLAGGAIVVGIFMFLSPFPFVQRLYQGLDDRKVIIAKAVFRRLSVTTLTFAVLSLVLLLACKLFHIPLSDPVTGMGDFMMVVSFYVFVITSRITSRLRAELEWRNWRETKMKLEN